MTGKIIKERYKIYDKVGSGGVATVYIARDMQTYEVVAIKILKTEYTDNPNYVKRFLREAEIVSSLNHQNITRVKDYGIEDELHFIVMEYVEGKMLSQLIEEKGAMGYQEASSFIAQVLSALQYAWENGIVAHRDIKPQNIMLDKNNMIKVMDFGIARVSSSNTMTQAGTFMGTPYYMSPEQAQGKETDIRSDIYSVGITLFQLITGKVPFDADTPWSVVNMHITQAPPVIEIPEPYDRLSYIMEKSLAKNVEDRYQNPQEMLFDIHTLTQHDYIHEESSNLHGEMSIQTDPPGARVFVNNELKGISPTIIRKLSAKNYKIRIEKEHYHYEEKNCTVVAGRRALLSLKLKAQTKSANTAVNFPQQAGASSMQATVIGQTSPIPSNVPVQAHSPHRSSGLLPLWITLGVLLLGALVAGSAFLWNQQQVARNRKVENLLNNPPGIIHNESPSNDSELSGILELSSDPSGAAIWLNGKDIGKKTPASISELSNSIHNVELRLEGHEAFSAQINVSGKTPFSARLVASREELGTIHIASTPSQARITINQQAYGLSPQEIRLASGTYAIVVEKDGYFPYSQTVAVGAGQKITITAPLTPKPAATPTPPVTPTPKPPAPTPTPQPPPTPKPPSEPATGTLWVLSDPDGAEVFINGALKGVTPFRMDKAPTGNYSVRIVKEGYETQTKSIQVSKDQIARIEFTLKRTALGNAILIINTNPSGAELYINGSLVGLSGPQAQFTVPEGTHTLLIRLEGYQDQTISITVKAGETRQLTYEMKKK